MNKIYVGVIVSTHGIKGEIRIISKLEQSLKEKVFKVGNSILINDKEYKLRSYRRHKNYDMVLLDDFNNINDVLFLMKQKVYIDSKYIEPSAVPYYLAKKFPKDWNIVVSRDEYDMQYCYLDKFSVISPKGDNSTFLTKHTMWNHIIEKENIKMDHPFYYDPKLFVTMKAIAGDRYRGIPRLKRCGWKTIFGYLDELSKFDDASKETCALQQDKLCDLIIHKNVDIDELNRNIYCIDVAQQVNAFMNTDIAIIDNCLEDMEDFVTLNKVNSDIFGEYPLNLNFLCRELIN